MKTAMAMASELDLVAQQLRPDTGRCDMSGLLHGSGIQDHGRSLWAP